MDESPDLFLQACRGQTLSRPPVWIMRQAGRYLPEYRAVRERVDFLTLCRTPELATEVTLQPIRRFGFDAAIVFSDIMMPLEAMGVQLQFNPGPVIENPIRDAAAVQRLRIPESDAIAPYVMDTIRLLRGALDVPLIGFAGAPLTLAAYLVEGKGSKDFSQLRTFLYAQPAAAKHLLDCLAETTLRYLRAQVAAGAQAVQLFDTWAGVVSLCDYRRFALQPIQKVLRGLRDCGVPRIYFAQDAAGLLPAIREIDAEVFGIDWRLDLRAARSALSPHAVLQGNLDPAILFSSPDAIRQSTRRVLESAGPLHIFNLGHGILPHTPIAGVEAMLDVLRT